MSQFRFASLSALVGVILLGCLLYLATLNGEILTADNGEFQWTSATLQIPHPPGFPLYTLLGYLFSGLPVPLPTPGRVTLLSAVTSSATLGVVFWIVYRLSSSNRLFPGILAAAALALSPTFWVQATIANIRSMTALFAALALLTVLEFADHPKERPDRKLFLYALALGLGLTHHLSLAFMALVMTAIVFWIDFSWIRSPKVWRSIFMAVGIALLPLVALPILNPELRNPAEFVSYALGLGFQGDFFYFRTLPDLALRSGVMWNVLIFQFHPVLLAAAGIGWLILLWERPKIAILLGGTFLIHTFITATYRAPQTVEYMLPAYLPIVIAFGYLFDVVFRFKVNNGPLTQTKWIVPTAVCFALLLQFRGTLPSIRALNTSTDTADVTSTLFRNTPENGLILADWHWYTALVGEQTFNQTRPDVDIEFVFPRTADYGVDWATEIQAGLDENRPVTATHFDEQAYTSLPTPRSVGAGFVFLPESLDTLSSEFEAADLRFGEEIQLTGYQLLDSGAVDEPIVLDIGWDLSALNAADLRLSAQLIQPSGRLVGQQDLPLPAAGEGISIQRISITPFVGTPPGATQLFLAVYRPDGTRLPTASGEAAATLTPAPLISNLEGSDWHPVTRHRIRWHQLINNRTLVGYDWDQTIPGRSRLYLHWQLDADGRYWTEAHDLRPGEPLGIDAIQSGGPFRYQFTTLQPEMTHYVPFGQGIVWLGPTRELPHAVTAGETVVVNQRFSTSRPLQRDIGIAVRLIGLEDDRFTWAWVNPDADNDIPALGAIPTLKWLAGSQVDHPRRLTIAAEAEPGQPVEGFMRLYDVFTNEPIPIRDQGIADSGRPWVVFDATIVSD